MKLIPLIAPMINWHALTEFYRSLGLEPLTKRLDKGRISPNDLTALPYLTGDLRLLHFGMLAEIEDINILLGTPLITTALEKNVYILVGSLLDWQTTFKTKCIEEQTYEVRKFYNECLIQFEKTTIKKLFSLSKKKLGDGTFKCIISGEIR